MERTPSTVVLRQVFRPGVIFCQRSSYTPYGVMPGLPALRNDREGGMMTTAGGMSMIVPTGVVSDEAEDLISTAGFVFPPRSTLHIHRSREEFESMVNATPDGCLAIDHLHPPGEIRDEAYWVPRSLVGRLADKAALAEWVPTDLLAERRVVERPRAQAAARDFLDQDGCCVIKATGPEPSGGGGGVEYVPSRGVFAETLARLAGKGPVVVERWIKAERSYCLNFALPASSPGTALYLGAAEQIIVHQVKYRGNLMVASPKIPDATVAAVHRIAEGMAGAGYHGLLGVDVIMAPDGRPIVLDINPRANASTAALIHAPGLRARTGQDLVFLLNVFHLPARTSEAMAIIRRGIRDHWLFPLRWYIYEPGERYAIKCGVLLVGTDVDQIESKTRILRHAGIVI